MTRPLVTALPLALFAACASSDGAADAGADAGELSPVEICERLSGARCDYEGRCHPAFSRPTNEGCRSVAQAQCLQEYEALRPGLDERTLGIDSDQARACEERMRSAACAPSFPPGYANTNLTPLADCLGTRAWARGWVQPGQPCSVNEECPAESRCVTFGDVCRGVCTALSTQDEACGIGCASGLFCDTQKTQSTVDDRCVPPRASGAPCTTSVECAADHWCDGTCKPRGKVGAVCRFDPDRLSVCEPGLACDVTPFVRGAQGTCVLPGDEGSACRFHFSCKEGLVCVLDWKGFPNQSPQPGACQKPRQAGESCPVTSYSTYVGDVCASGTYCEPALGVCAPIPELGQACSASSQVCGGFGVFCKPSASGNVGTCTNAVSTGETCAIALDATRTLQVPCASGACDASGSRTCQPPNKVLGEPCQSDGECLSNRCAVQQDQSIRCAMPCE